MPGPTFTLPTILMSALEIKNGNSITGTIDCTGMAGSAQTILLVSDTVGITVTPSVSISTGDPVGDITVSCANVEVGSVATITAYYYGASQTVRITVSPASLGGASFSLAGVIGGHTVDFTVTLDSTDNIDGVTVYLFDYAPPGGYSHLFTDVPLYVIVAAGSLTATITVTTRRVSRAVYGSIRAVYSGSVSTASVYILP